MPVTARRALVTVSVTAGWIALLAYAHVSARAILASGALDGAARALNAALLVVELALGAFGLLLLGALTDAPRVPATLAVPRADACPAVDVLIPVRGEDARVLGTTLAAARRLEWPAGKARVRVLDDTEDDALAGALRDVALKHGAEYARRAHRRGRKAGALNDALAASRAKYTAVLDVDHAPDPQWLARAVPVLEADANLAFVQGKIAWRNADAPFRRLQALLQAHFFEIIQRAKGTRGAAVFAGSAAVFRRRALEDAGGFPEDTLVEDYDATTVLLARGWSSAFDPRVAAHGLLPWTSTDFARQLWRWAHGTTRILVHRARDLLFPRPRNPDYRGRWRTRVECFTDGFAYTAAGLFVLAGVLLATAAATGTPLPRAAPGIVLGPALVAGAHTLTAAVALHRSGARDVRAYAWVLPYHVVSIAFTPVLLAATLAAWVGVGERAEGRVSKDPRQAFAAKARGVRGATLLACALGVALVLAAVTLRHDAGTAWVWAAELGIAFTLPALVSAREWHVARSDARDGADASG